MEIYFLTDETKLVELFQKFVNYLNIVLIGIIVLFLIMAWYYIPYFILAFKKHKKFEKGNIDYKYAVLIPARNEHKVIKNCLDALVNQDYPKDKYDVFVIIESKDDPTFEIVNKYPSNFHVVIRKDLINKRTKGYALNEAYTYIKENNMSFDAFMIFDADNIMESNYISLMNDCKNKGYQVVTGYRNFTNASVNWVSSDSALLFSFINNFTSNGRSHLFKKATLSGTGYYVDFDIIDKEGGWIFNGMTEDVELTTYCYYHNISMLYYPYAIYYDEQSPKMSVVHKQHIRWTWGFFEDRNKFKKKELDYGCLNKHAKRLSLWEYNFSLFPFASLCIVEIIAFLIGLGLFIASMVFLNTPTYQEAFWQNQIPRLTLISALIAFAYLYLTFILVAILVFAIDNKRLKFKWYRIVISTLTYMFFMSDFVLAFLDGLFHKNKRKTWDKIDHEGKIVDSQALRSQNEKE